MFKIILGPIVAGLTYVVVTFVGGAILIFAVASDLGHDPGAGARAVTHAGQVANAFVTATAPALLDVLSSIFAAVGAALS